MRKECVGRKTERGQQEDQPLKCWWGEDDRIQTAGKVQRDHVTLRGAIHMPAIVSSHL